MKAAHDEWVRHIDRHIDLALNRLQTLTPAKSRR